MLLLIDDEPDILAEIQEWFEWQGWDCLCAGRLAEAERLLAGRDDIRLVVTDLKLVDGEAFGLIEARLARLPAPDFIIVTGHAGEPEIEHARRIGVQLLHKPLDLAALDAAVAATGHLPRGTPS
ncbi:response regulator [Plasticicumulans sp.]|uniref:response regulator n=1 Tax=Plasticicumulans sp. TaxID=2307179 RepID=UPI002C6242DB|nr:response regulator [Plasticicumulans sp.]HNE01112.1 response regulator [Plasticicumulans sp.]